MTGLGPRGKINIPLQASLGLGILNKVKINKFFLTLFKRILIYILFILPFILISKSLYSCWHDNNFTLTFFYQNLLSTIPFLGENFMELFWKENSMLSIDNIKINQNIIQLILFLS